MFNRSMLRGWALSALVFLAACGGQPATPNAAASPTRLPDTSPATVTAAQVPAPGNPAQAGVPTAGGTQAENADIPSSVTPEGYHVLGRPDAPVTLVMYSDFL